MPKVVLASALARWLPPDEGMTGGERVLEVAGERLVDVLDGLFVLHPGLRGYVLDEQGSVRHHVAVFVDGRSLRDKHDLSQSLDAHSEVHVVQALSGG